MLNAQTLEQQLRQLLLPTFIKRHIELATLCESQQKSHLHYLSLWCIQLVIATLSPFFRCQNFSRTFVR
jgi:hypothetical protein